MGEGSSQASSMPKMELHCTSPAASIFWIGGGLPGYRGGVAAMKRSMKAASVVRDFVGILGLFSVALVVIWLDTRSRCSVHLVIEMHL